MSGAELSEQGKAIATLVCLILFWLFCQHLNKRRIAKLKKKK